MNKQDKSIDDLLTTSRLRRMAGGRSYARGEDYFEGGAVRHMYCDGMSLTADVSGSQVYRASIRVREGELDGKCSCPMGQDGCFCKHLVALGLAYLKKGRIEKRNKSSFSWPNFLKGCERDELIKIILEMSPKNTDVIEKYRMANLHTMGDTRLKELKSKIDEIYVLAEELEGCYDEYDSYGELDSEEEFIQQKKLLVGVLDRLAAQEEYQLVWDASTYGLNKLFDISTSDYDLVQEFAQELMESFLKSVNGGIKDEEEIFAFFTALEQKGNNFGYGVLSDALGKLPKAIRERWSSEALEIWRSYPKMKLELWGDHDKKREYIERHLLSWAKEHQENELRLKIMEKGLQYPADIIELSKEYRRQGMTEKIIPLLQSAYKQLEHPREILELMIEELQKSGNGQQALDLAWQEFTSDIFSYFALERLEKAAAYLKCWKEYYQKVLDFLEELETQKSKPSSLRYHDSNDIRQYRIQVLFNHGDKETAWELAKDARLSEEWWLKLAEWRSKISPVEASALLRKIVEKNLVPTGEGAYSIVVEHLKLLCKYMTKAGKKDEFTAYCSAIRSEYKRRRLLLAQMDEAKL